MPLQIIFCVETNKRADTDSIYISETIKHWYYLDNKTNISKIYMNSKSRYNSKDVLREIHKMTLSFSIGKTQVIYCIDTDQYEKNANHAKELEGISLFCKEQNYDLIWFCHDVEEVFLGQCVSDSQKVRAAASFRRKNEIHNIHIDTLTHGSFHVHSSNLMSIWDKYLPRKE